MAPTSKFRLAAAVTVALAIPAALVAACSSNSNPAPNTPVVYTVADSGEDSTTSTTGPDGNVITPDGSTVTPPTGDGGTADGSNEAQAPACTSQQTDAGCWICPSQTPTSNEFLNQCSGTGVHCSPYSNAANIPGYDGGPLVWSN
jgi:hypothetical protein